MANDIVSAPAGYMFIYLSALALFAWNFYRIVRQRPQAVRIEDRHSPRSNAQPHGNQQDYTGRREAA